MNIASSQQSRPGYASASTRTKASHQTVPTNPEPNDEFQFSPVFKGVLSGAAFGFSTALATRQTGVIPIGGVAGGFVAPALVGINGFTGGDDLLGAATLGIPAGLLSGFLGAGLGAGGVVASSLLFGAASGLLAYPGWSQEK